MYSFSSVLSMFSGIVSMIISGWMKFLNWVVSIRYIISSVIVKVSSIVLLVFWYLCDLFF